MFRRHRVITAAFASVLTAFAMTFVVRNGASLGRLVDGIGSIDPGVAALGMVCSLLAITNRGMLNRAAHRAVGLDAGIGAMTQTAAVGFAAQKMVKSAGAIGLAVFVRDGRRRGHAAAHVAGACVLTATASFLALGVLLVAAVTVLAATGRLTGWWIAAAVGFAIYALLVGVLAVVVVRSRRAAAALWRAGHRVRRRLSRERGADLPDRAFPVDLFDAVAAARRRPDAIRLLMFHAVWSKVLGASMLAAAVAAVGLPVSPTQSLVIYATALAASMVTIVPGGLGAVEGSTAALLLGTGATVGSAALAVALFRLFDLWLPVLTGALAARRRVGERASQRPKSNVLISASCSASSATACSKRSLPSAALAPVGSPM